MTVVTVSNSQALMNAVQFAADGDVIKLAPGTYSSLIFRNANFASGITITSADPNKPAVITDLKVRGSDGLTFSNLNLTNTGNLNLAFQFSGSSNLTLDNLKVSGVPGSAAAMNAQLMIIRDSSNIQLTNSEFAYGYHGVSLLNTSFATVQGNYFHDLRTDGVRGGGNSDYTIRSNVFTNFHPAVGDHPDAIQLWTNNTSTSAKNILIDSNIIIRGDGTPTQGIFMRDISGITPFQNVVVTNNVVLGGRYNGIAISGVNNGFFADNIVQSFPDQPSGIRLQTSTGVVVQGNETSKFYIGTQTFNGQNGNVLIGSATDAGVGTLNYWFNQHPEFVSAWSTIDPTVLSVLHHSSGSAVPPVGSGSYVPAPSAAPTPEPATDTGGITTDAEQSAAPAPSKITGTAAGDVIDGAAGDDAIGGGAGNDLIRSGDGRDRVLGGTGNDKLLGGVGDDRLHGGDGNDSIDGGSGNDLIDGGTGDDAMTGGAGADIFRFRAADSDLGDVDVITDFQSGTDRIHIVDGINASPQTFIGAQAFHRQAGEIRYVDGTAGVTVQADINGDGAADFDFLLRGVHQLSVKDFIV